MSTLPSLNSNRILILDALRGFALFGILITHAFELFPQVQTPVDSTIDKLVTVGVKQLLSGRLFSIFSFLFGVSYAIQFKNNQLGAKYFYHLTMKRLIILFIIGYLHSLVFLGDILQTYALLGLLLILGSQLKSSTTLWVSLLLFLASISVQFFKLQIGNSIIEWTIHAKNSSILRFLGFYKFDYQFLSGQYLLIASLFFLGFNLGSRNIFIATEKNLHLHKKMLVCSSVGLFLSISVLIMAKISELPSNYLDAIIAIEKILSSFFYLSFFIYAFYSSKFKLKNWFNILIPAGRMGLTLYLMQSVYLVFFYKLFASYIIQLGLPATLMVCSLFYYLQIRFATKWLRMHQTGPIEWILRTLTNLQIIEPLKSSYAKILR